MVCVFSPLVLLFTVRRHCREEKAKFMGFRLLDYPSVSGQCVKGNASICI